MSIEDKVQKAESELARKEPVRKPMSRRKKIAIYTIATLGGGLALGYAGFKAPDFFPKNIYNASSFMFGGVGGLAYFLDQISYCGVGNIVGGICGYLIARKYMKRRNP